MTGFRVEQARAEDVPTVLDLVARAFPAEDLGPLVRDLTSGDADVLSLIARKGNAPVGFALFTRFRIRGVSTTSQAALLGPIAIDPRFQRRGFGARLIDAGIERLRRDGVGIVLLLGDPAYYSRHGFRPERKVRPPYDLPSRWQDAWQSRLLSDVRIEGKCELPEAWMKKTYWAP